ncbi:putative homeodomain transcription factor 2 [Phytophthora boehmeriae]|uniref:Putative homeodomain transcription factor 2 n=1 Tax=Phytophthora boehmeriae TaxID=109152 RepID=A0A8T1WN91_9STRA|nr:putative homeodomain transcription factor 2 [Phytophthora boehmeriae]
MDDEAFRVTPPRRLNPKRLQRKAESSAEVILQQQRVKREMNFKRELIDFDLIKGSALFHTKPSSHDRKLVQEGLSRALFVPFHAKFWRQKPWFYETVTALYSLHVVAVGIYLFYPKTTSALNAFEVIFPLLLLLLVAICYGRVSSALQVPDSDPVAKILSPILKQVTDTTCGSESDNSLTASGLEPGLAESENSDGTDSDEDSGNSSSSSDESTSNDILFPHKSSSAPSSPKRVNMRPPIARPPKSLPASAPLQRLERRDSILDQFARRRVKVCVWEEGFPVKRAMSITELRNTILAKVKATPPRMFYRKVAEMSAVMLALVPIALRFVIKCQEVDCLVVTQEPLEVLSWVVGLSEELSAVRLYSHAQELASGSSIIAISCMLSTYYMASIIFAALADAELTYHRRFLYAKCFTALTSSRRSRLANLPHFRLKNVINIKAWISLRGGRTWLKRQGRQRAADEVVSTSFLVILVLLVVMGMQAVSDGSGSGSLQAESILYIEVAIWCMLSSVFMLRFMMLGSSINKKYQNTSLLLTEQMNVYLRLLAKPHKKEKLLVSNNVLKLACKLLKELNSPNKVSGLTMNPLLYNITRVVVLSAFSSTASDFFGFKLKLWKLKA